MKKGQSICIAGGWQIFYNQIYKSDYFEVIKWIKDIFFYVVANDLFQEMVGDKYLRENYWKYLSEVIIMMYHTAKRYSDMAKNIEYRLRVDTSLFSADECADIIVKKLF